MTKLQQQILKAGLGDWVPLRAIYGLSSQVGFENEDGIKAGALSAISQLAAAGLIEIGEAVSYTHLVWAATRGRWVVRYTEHEFCHLLAGRVVLTSEEGERMEFGRGDSFVVPAGFVGTWEVLEECRKLYAIFEAR